MTAMLFDIASMTNEERFQQCLKEANELRYGDFSPDLNNLVEQDISSIMFKVLIEYDLVTEGQPHFENSTEDEKDEWLEKARKFFRRWRDWIEVEEEKKLYQFF